MHKVVEMPPLSSHKINEIIELLDVPEILHTVTKETTIMIITRIIKAMVGEN
jgi:arginine repressor